MITISNDIVDLEIDAETGEIQFWKYQGKQITNQAIRPNFWRASTDNDLGNNMHEWAKIWQDGTYNYRAKLEGNPFKSSNGVCYKVNYNLPNDEPKVEVIVDLKSERKMWNIDLVPIKKIFPIFSVWACTSPYHEFKCPGMEKVKQKPIRTENRCEDGIVF